MTIVGSNGTECRWKNDEFDYYGKKLMDGASIRDNDNGLLRNEFGQAYLSVQGDSCQDGAYVILDRQWRNSSGQRWKFINNQLANDHGKCLTVSTLSSFLFQRSCNFSYTAYNKMRQTCRRKGLQIVTNNINPLRARLLNNMFLAFVGSKDDDTMYAILEKCDFAPPFLWYDWD